MMCSGLRGHAFSVKMGLKSAILVGGLWKFLVEGSALVGMSGCFEIEVKMGLSLSSLQDECSIKYEGESIESVR